MAFFRKRNWRRLLLTGLLCLPALALLWGFWYLVSWNKLNTGFNSYNNWTAHPGWEYRLGDISGTTRGLPDPQAVTDWTPLSENMMPSEVIPSDYAGYYWFRAKLPENLTTDGLYIHVRGFKAVQLFTDTRRIYDFNMEPRDFKVNKHIHWGLAPLESADFETYIYVRAYNDGTSPSFGSFLIGKPEAFYLDMLGQDVLRIVFCILFLFLSMSTIILFAVNYREPIYLHFAVLTTCAAYGSINRAPTLQLFADIPLFVYLQDVVFTAGAAGLIGFLSRIYTGDTGRLFRTFMWSLWAFAALVFVIALNDEPLYHFLIDKVLIGLLIVYMSITLFLMARSYRRSRDRETLWIFVGILLLLLFAVLYYVQMNVYPFAHMIYTLSPFLAVYMNEAQLVLGVFLFVLCLGAVLILRFADTLQQIKRYAVELVAKNHQLQEMDRMKDDFLARTSHELRTPLFGITGMAESLLDQSVLTEKEDRRRLSLIIAGSRRLTRLVNDILDLSKLQYNDLHLAVRPLDIRPMLEAAAALLEPQARTKGLAIRCSIPSELPMVLADEDRIEQILFNLLGNAVKFTTTGEISVTVSTDGPSGAGFLHVSVSDSGLGIPERDLEHIFERFNQSRHTLEQGIGGTGLGLTISKQLVELHGGRLTVESQLGLGSTFTFSLPLCSGEVMESGAIPRKGPSEVVQAGVIPVKPDPLQPLELQGNQVVDKTILLVDDEPMNLEVLSAHLSPPYRIVTCSRPEQALEILENGMKPDLIITDVMMPGMSGYELSRKIRQTFGEADLPVLMLTAKSLTEDLTEGFRSGANDYLPKPVSKQELLSRVKLHLKVTELNRSLEEEVRERTSELEKRNLELQFSIQETMDALREIVALEERNRIAHEIHDTVGHTMTATIMQLEATKRLLSINRELALEKLSAAQGLIRNGLDQIRSVVRMLKDDVVKTDLLESLVKLISETEDITGVSIDYDIGSLPELPPLYRKVIYHALQEGLTNGLKHGSSSKFEFRLYAMEGRLLFSLKNNGSPYEDSPYGFGLSAMRERVVHLGGTLQLNEPPGWGCDLQIVLPA